MCNSTIIHQTSNALSYIKHFNCIAIHLYSENKFVCNILEQNINNIYKNYSNLSQQPEKNSKKYEVIQLFKRLKVIND